MKKYFLLMVIFFMSILVSCDTKESTVHSANLIWEWQDANYYGVLIHFFSFKKSKY